VDRYFTRSAYRWVGRAVLNLQRWRPVPTLVRVCVAGVDYKRNIVSHRAGGKGIN